MQMQPGIKRRLSFSPLSPSQSESETQRLKVHILTTRSSEGHGGEGGEGEKGEERAVCSCYALCLAVARGATKNDMHLRGERDAHSKKFVARTLIVVTYSDAFVDVCSLCCCMFWVLV